MKPTDNELEMAIVAAETMREPGKDEHYVARSLLYLYQRMLELEKVCAAAENYLGSVQEEPQHAELVLAIEAAARNAEQRETGIEAEDPGLG